MDYQNRGLKPGSDSIYNLGFEPAVVDDPTNQIYVFDIIHKWFEEQQNFEFGHQILVANFSPQMFFKQFVINYYLDHSLYFEILPGELKDYILGEGQKTVRNRDKKMRNAIRKKYYVEYAVEAAKNIFDGFRYGK